MSLFTSATPVASLPVSVDFRMDVTGIERILEIFTLSVAVMDT